MTKGTYRIRQHCGGRYKRKKGLRRVHELVKVLRRQGISRISIVEKSVEAARQLKKIPYWAVKDSPKHTYWELTFIKEGTDEY